MRKNKGLEQCQMCRVVLDMDDEYTPYHNVPGIGVCCEGCAQEAAGNDDIKTAKEFGLSAEDLDDDYEMDLD